MNDPIITGILSYGMSGRVFHAPFIDADPDFQLYAVTERTKKQAGERYPEVISYDSVDELLADPEIELVIINTPNYTHYEYSLKALEAGKHILVEKPFASSAAEAQQVFRLARERNLKVMPYQNRRWDSDFRLFKKVLQEGALGRLSEVSLRFDRYRKDIGPKTFKEEPVPASGIAWDLGPHLVDQAISLFGKPLSSARTTGIFRPGSKVNDYVHFHLKYPDDLNVFITASLLVANPLPAFVAHGSEGSFIKSRADVQEDQLQAGMSPLEEGYGEEPEGAEGTLTRVSPEGAKQNEYITSLRANYGQLFAAVSSCIRTDTPFPVKEEEIIWQMKILEDNF